MKLALALAFSIVFLLGDGSAMTLSDEMAKLKQDLWQLNYEIENIKKEIIEVCPPSTIVFHPKLFAQSVAKETLSGLKAELRIRRQTHQQFLQIYVGCLTGEQVTKTTFFPWSTSRPTPPTTPLPTTTTSTTTTTTTTTPPTTTTTTTTTTPTTTTLSPIVVRLACRFAVNLTQEARTDDAGSRICPDGNPLCDLEGMIQSGRPWFRFTEGAGRYLLDEVPPMRSCGTDAPIWSDDQPKFPIVGSVYSFDAYSHWRFNSKYKTFPMQLIRCGNNDIIYRYQGSEVFCNSAFCGKN